MTFQKPKAFVSVNEDAAASQCLKITEKCRIWIFQFWHFHQFLSY